MKLCWDNLEKVRYVKKSGTFRYKTHTYYEHDSCLECKEPYLGTKSDVYCTHECQHKSKKNRQKISKGLEGKPLSVAHRKKLSTIGKGRIASITARKNISIGRRGKLTGEEHPRYDGGYASNNIPKYDLYASQLEPYGEECRRNEKDPNVLEVKCTYCGKWFKPTRYQIIKRIAGIYSTDGWRLYHSPECKQECPIYGKSKYSADHPKNKRGSGLNIEVPPEFRQMVFARDNHTCQRCGSTESLHCHHVMPKKIDPLSSADLYNGVTLCKPCHKWVHMNIPGCGYNELAKLEGLCR